MDPGGPFAIRDLQDRSGVVAGSDDRDHVDVEGRIVAARMPELDVARPALLAVRLDVTLLVALDLEVLQGRGEVIEDVLDRLAAVELGDEDDDVNVVDVARHGLAAVRPGQPGDRGLLDGVEQVGLLEMVADDRGKGLSQGLPVFGRVQVLQQAVEMIVQGEHGDGSPGWAG